MPYCGPVQSGWEVCLSSCSSGRGAPTPGGGCSDRGGRDAGPGRGPCRMKVWWGASSRVYHQPWESKNEAQRCAVTCARHTISGIETSPRASGLLCPHLPPSDKLHVGWANDLFWAYSWTRSTKSWCCWLSGRVQSHLAMLRDGNSTRARWGTRGLRGKSLRAAPAGQRKRNSLVGGMNGGGTTRERKDVNTNNLLT